MIFCIIFFKICALFLFKSKLLSYVMKLQLRKFDMASIASDSVVVFVGKRQTGKSVLVRDLLYYQRDIPVGTVISGTEAANSFYSKMVPPLFIHGEYDEDIVKKILTRQTRLITQKNKNPNDKTNPGTFLIFDDCLYDNSWTKSKFVRSLFMNGRHYKILFLLTMQFALGIPPNLRTNIDYVFILRENIISNRKRIYDSYAGMFPNFEIFCDVMNQCTENYECLVIHCNSKSNKLEDQVFWYKAEQHEDFRLGSEQLWRFHRENYNVQNNQEDEEEWDPSQFRKKTKTPINVHKYSEFM